MICKDCRYMKTYKWNGNQRGRCFCEHEKATETFNKVCPISPRMAGFICYTLAETFTPATKTAPRWCPLKEENNV